MTDYEIEVLNTYPITDIEYGYSTATIKTEKLSIKVDVRSADRFRCLIRTNGDKIREHNRSKLLEVVMNLNKSFVDTWCNIQ